MTGRNSTGHGTLSQRTFSPLVNSASALLGTATPVGDVSYLQAISRLLQIDGDTVRLVNYMDVASCHA